MRANLAVATGAHDDAYALARRAARDLAEQDDVTGWLATTHLLAGTLALTGRPPPARCSSGRSRRSAGRSATRRSGWTRSTPGSVAAVTAALSPAAYTSAHAQGLLMDRAAARAYIDAL